MAVLLVACTAKQMTNRAVDLLDTTTDDIRALVNRKHNPLSWLEATFTVAEGLSDEVAGEVLQQLLRQRFLAVYDADMAQMLATRLGTEVKWSHAELNGDGIWKEGRAH